MSVFEPCPTCGGSGLPQPFRPDLYDYEDLPPSERRCSGCVGGRVVSESVIEEMGRALQQMWEADAEGDEDPYEWDELTGDEKRFWETWAGAAARVVLEHMEDNDD